jgi:hypothetical protein
MLEHDYPNAAHYTMDLLKDRAIQSINRQGSRWQVFSCPDFCAARSRLNGRPWCPACCGADSFAWWSSAIRYGPSTPLLHRFGSRPFATDDNSHKAGIVSLLFRRILAQQPSRLFRRILAQQPSRVSYLGQFRVAPRLDGPRLVDGGCVEAAWLGERYSSDGRIPYRSTI